MLLPFRCCCRSDVAAVQMLLPFRCFGGRSSGPRGSRRPGARCAPGVPGCPRVSPGAGSLLRGVNATVTLRPRRPRGRSTVPCGTNEWATRFPQPVPHRPVAAPAAPESSRCRPPATIGPPLYAPATAAEHHPSHPDPITQHHHNDSGMRRASAAGTPVTLRPRPRTRSTATEEVRTFDRAATGEHCLQRGPSGRDGPTHPNDNNRPCDGRGQFTQRCRQSPRTGRTIEVWFVWIRSS
ncbi:hypothetical protein CcI6DRAFT_02801 [Frankia sp. CcI6]|nr:hypothetical protein CcI6DRAFT_02801 [Frankia sp. CcI6]